MFQIELTIVILVLGRLSFEKKKVVNFHNFGPKPPKTPKSCETSILFFFTS